jgi:diacylglycerol kinase family enzyme
MSGSAFGDLTVIVNPNAARGVVGERVPELREALAAQGLPYELHMAGSAREAEDAARGALRSGGRFVVAVGGDGTVQAVLNGFFDDGRPIVEGPVLGVVGAGSGCDLLRTFGLPSGTTDAVGHLTGENVYPFDVVRATVTGPGGERVSTYVHNLAEVGLGASVILRRKDLPAWTGRARDFLGFWLALARSRSVRVTIEADSRSFEAEAFNVVIGNAQFTNGGLRLSPRSFPGDGVLDVLVFTGPRSDAVTMLPRIFRHGDHVPDPHIHEMRSKIRVAIDADRTLAVVADGNDLGQTPATFQILPRRILMKL